MNTPPAEVFGSGSPVRSIATGQIYVIIELTDQYRGCGWVYRVVGLNEPRLITLFEPNELKPLEPIATLALADEIASITDHYRIRHVE